MRCVVASGFHRASVNSFACHAITTIRLSRHVGASRNRRNRSAQSPNGRTPDRRAIRRSIARTSRTASRRCPASCASTACCAANASQQVGLARLDLRRAAPRGAASPSRARLAAPPCRAASTANSAPSGRVRALHAVEHHGAVHQVGERVRLQQVRGRRSRSERHERLPCALVEPGLDGLRVRARRARSCSPPRAVLAGGRACGEQRSRRTPGTGTRRWSSATDARASHHLFAQAVGAFASRLDRRLGDGDRRGADQRGQREQRHHDAAARSVRRGRPCSPHVPPSVGPARRLTSRRAR